MAANFARVFILQNAAAGVPSPLQFVDLVRLPSRHRSTDILRLA
jgi:hypothetical protein